MTIVVGILLFPAAEILDVAGPYEVFAVATRMATRNLAFDTPPFQLVTVAEQQKTVGLRHGLRVAPDFSIADAPRMDVVIVPGGIVADAMRSRSILVWLQQEFAHGALTASVCTGAFILASMGILDGLSATTHWEDIDEMRRRFPRVSVVEGVPYVDEGQVVTSAGISAGISMSLHLVDRMIGPELARLTARQMQYDWCPA